MIAAWGAFVLLAASFAAYAVWTYRKRELPIRGRDLLAGLRASTLVLLLVLLWNPAVPGDASAGAARSWMLLDVSASMAVPSGTGGATPWDSALAVVARRDEGALLATFGQDVEAWEGEEPPAGAPGAGRSALAPALERAAEAGARRVTVVSDLRVEDPVAVEAALSRLRLDVHWVDVGSDARNAGIEAVEGPAAIRAGQGAAVEVVAFASGVSAGDSILVEVLEEGLPVASERVAAPAPGRRARVSLDVPPPDAEGEVRYQARVTLDGDVHPDDDQGAAYVAVAPEDGALVLVSLAPDWEPRFLLPVLEGVTGLRGRGFLRVGPGSFLPVDAGSEGGTVAPAAVSRAAASAELLVLHGVGADVPAWVGEAAAGARRLLLLPAAAAAAGLTGLEAAGPRSGEWYVAPDLPPSPLAGELSGVAVTSLPPLGPLLPLGNVGAGEVVFRLQLRGSGAALPGLVLRDGEGSRSATALASGFWRWAFRPGETRETYRRLWSGVAGWLLAETTPAAGGDVAPVEKVVPAGEPVTWSAGAAAGDSVTLRISRGDSLVSDTVLGAGTSGTFRTPPLPRGTYAFSAAVGADSASGRFDVAPPAELGHPRMATPDAAVGSGGGAADRIRRPVRTHPLPYLVLLALLSAEWTLRRRRGLR